MKEPTVRPGVERLHWPRETFSMAEEFPIKSGFCMLSVAMPDGTCPSFALAFGPSSVTVYSQPIEQIA